MNIIKRALISVFDKTGIEVFAKNLASKGIEIISTGGTYNSLKAAGIPVLKIDELTRFPEMLDGRVKTLHPNIHGGLLARRDIPAHMRQLHEHNISLIDLVVVNLYPFEQTVHSGATFEECIEQIDIGGPSMLRSAAKNFSSVTAICDVVDYNRVWMQIEKDGNTSLDLRLELARKVFSKTSLYDSAIVEYLSEQAESASVMLPDNVRIVCKKTIDLRYGENPHQKAALYGNFFSIFDQLHGKELSFNNIVDIQAACALVEEFSQPASAIIKHTNPSGCAVGETVHRAYLEALTTDPVSAFGGVIAVNREIDESFAEKLNEIFSEVIIAPSFSPAAKTILQKKRDRRLLIQKVSLKGTSRFDMKAIANGYLCQSMDNLEEDSSLWTVASLRKPTEYESQALDFAWRVAKHVKSNAIVYTNNTKTLGIGAGQMSRVDSCALASMKAGKAGLDLKNSVVASDAFLPFADGLMEAVRAGATAVVQPGGSVRDAEVIEAANENGIAMVFTGIRHFKH